MKSDFNSWYKSKFNEFGNTPPPEEVWQNIADELDIDESWGDINSRLDKNERNRKIALISFSIAAILLLNIGIYFINGYLFGNKTSPVNQANHPLNTIQKIYKQQAKMDNHSVIQPKLKAIEKEQQAVSTLISTIQEQQQIPNEPLFVAQNNMNETNAEFSSSEGLISLEIRKNISGNMSMITPMLIGVNINKYTIDSLITGLKSLRGKTTSSPHFITLGVMASSLNTWVLNSDVYNGLRKNTLTQTELSFGYSYGIWCNYNLNQKYSSQLEWAVNNKQTQSYVDYIEGREVKKNINLQCTQLNVLFKKRNATRITRNNLQLTSNYLAGLQYGYITSVAYTADRTTTLVDNQYKNSNYSLVLGWELQLLVIKKVFISPGLRANVGIRNLYSGDAKVPDSFNQTYNSSLGFNLGIGYKFN